MRIISGSFKGKKILEPKDKKTRPLKDLTKESIFNIIRHSNKFKINFAKFIYIRSVFWCRLIWN
jgi:16S rRNA (guanine966-N2)-methyltransferase